MDKASGLFLSPPSTNKWMDFLESMLYENTFANNSPISPDIALEICKEAKEIFESHPSPLITLDATEKDHLMLVGDIHGQFNDLVFQVLLPESSSLRKDGKDLMVLFLGDYVDRGPMSVEVFFFLLTLKISFPNRVFLLRGNHECPSICMTYGFMTECVAKLNSEVWETVCKLFNFFPLAATVTTSRGRFFCVHGGLNSQAMEFDNIRLMPPMKSFAEDTDNWISNENSDAELIKGLLWSDPGDKPGFQSSPRGYGVRFGPDVSESFCERNQFRLICRAHELVMGGFRWDHDLRVLTLFSAPNYCGSRGNLGAYAIVDTSIADSNTNGNRIAFTFHTYHSVTVTKSEINLCPQPPEYFTV